MFNQANQMAALAGGGGGYMNVVPAMNPLLRGADMQLMGDTTLLGGMMTHSNGYNSNAGGFSMNGMMAAPSVAAAAQMNPMMNCMMGTGDEGASGGFGGGQGSGNFNNSGGGGGVHYQHHQHQHHHKGGRK